MQDEFVSSATDLTNPDAWVTDAQRRACTCGSPRCVQASTRQLSAQVAAQAQTHGAAAPSALSPKPPYSMAPAAASPCVSPRHRPAPAPPLDQSPPALQCAFDIRQSAACSTSPMTLPYSAARSSAAGQCANLRVDMLSQLQRPGSSARCKYTKSIKVAHAAGGGVPRG